MADKIYLDSSFIPDVGFHKIREWLASHCRCEENIDYFINLKPTCNQKKLEIEFQYTDELVNSMFRKDNYVIKKLIKGVVEIKKNKNKNKKIKFGNINVVKDWGWAPEYINAMQLIANSNSLKDHVICTGNAISLRTFIRKG